MSNYLDLDEVVKFMNKVSDPTLLDKVAKRYEKLIESALKPILVKLANRLNVGGYFGDKPVEFKFETNAKYDKAKKRFVCHVEITAVNAGTNVPHLIFHFISAGRSGRISTGTYRVKDTLIHNYTTYNSGSSYKEAYAGPKGAGFPKHKTFPQSGARTDTNLNIMTYSRLRMDRDEDDWFSYRPGQKMGGWYPRKVYDAVYNHIKDAKQDFVEILKIFDFDEKSIKFSNLDVDDKMV